MEVKRNIPERNEYLLLFFLNAFIKKYIPIFIRKVQSKSVKFIEAKVTSTGEKQYRNEAIAEIDLLSKSKFDIL